jgi:hypothetical protein
MAKLTVRGTRRLTSAERSAIMVRAWKKRRKTGTAPATPRQKRTGPPDPVRSAAMAKSWRQRQRTGLAPKKQKRKLLSHRKRSAISRAAAALRLSRRDAQMRCDCRLLGLPPRSSWADIRKAFAAARRRLRLPTKAKWIDIRKALQADKPTSRQMAPQAESHALAA